MYDIFCPNVTKNLLHKISHRRASCSGRRSLASCWGGGGAPGAGWGPIQRGVPDHRHTRVEEVQVTPGLPGGLHHNKH